MHEWRARSKKERKKKKRRRKETEKEKELAMSEKRYFVPGRIITARASNYDNRQAGPEVDKLLSKCDQFR